MATDDSPKRAGGAERAPRYRDALPLETRRAIVEILRDTKPDLPAYFALVSR